MHCENCNKPTHNPKFCSLKCSGEYSAKNTPYAELSKKGKCRGCGIPILRNVRHCKECWELYKDKPTKREYRTLNPNCCTCNKVKTIENTQLKDDLWNMQCRECVATKKRKQSRVAKQNCIDYKGGRCEVCGYSKCMTAIEFHHRDPSQKDFDISRRRTVKLTDEFKRELDKCAILCANCHREEHLRLTEGRESLLVINKTNKEFSVWDFISAGNKEYLTLAQ